MNRFFLLLLFIGISNLVLASAGDLDPSFDLDGKSIDFGSDDIGTAVAIQTDGKIVAAGSAVTSSADFAVVRYNIDGSLDPKRARRNFSFGQHLIL